MPATDSTPDGGRTERPRRWFLEQGSLATGAAGIVLVARFLRIDAILILWAGMAGASGAQDAVRFVFGDMLPIFLLVGGFGLYLLARGLSMEGQTGRITRRDSRVARLCGLLLVGYAVSLLL